MVVSSSFRVRNTTDPSQLSDAERTYYRTVWGFDPVEDCHPTALYSRRYEACFGLTQDLPLKAIDIKICARVEWQGEEAIHNRIVFRRGGNESAVECTHTLVYAGPTAAALTFAEDTYTVDENLSATDRAFLARSSGPVPLPPWEHFAALKSYVAAVAEIGITTMLRATIPSGDTGDLTDSPEVPFGFNSFMQSQISAALLQIAPDASFAMRRDFIYEYLDVASPRWVMARWAVLRLKTPIVAVLLHDVDLLVDWVGRWVSEADPPFTEEVLRKDIGKVLVDNWEKIIRTWTPAMIIKLFRMSNLLDVLQARLFLHAPISDPQDSLLLQAKALAPDVPWDLLCLEWQARDNANFNFTHIGGLPIEDKLGPKISDLEVELNQMPPAEIWPRNPLCNTEVPARVIPRPSKDAAAGVISERVSQFYYQVKNNSVHDDFTRQWTEDIKDHSLVLHPLPKFWDQILSPSNFSPARFQPVRIDDPLPLVYETARHPSASIKNLRDLASHWDLATRLVIVAHPNIDMELLQKMQQDNQPSVRAIAEARLLRGTPVIAPIPGEILTPGEILWLLVENEQATLLFGVLNNMRGGREYRNWFQKRLTDWRHRENQRRRAEGDGPIFRKDILGRIFFWSYWRGFIFTPGPATFIALSGLRDLACGDFPCIFLGVYLASSKGCKSYRESLLKTV